MWNHIFHVLEFCNTMVSLTKISSSWVKMFTQQVSLKGPLQEKLSTHISLTSAKYIYVSWNSVRVHFFWHGTIVRRLEIFQESAQASTIEFHNNWKPFHTEKNWIRQDESYVPVNGFKSWNKNRADCGYQWLKCWLCPVTASILLTHIASFFYVRQRTTTEWIDSSESSLIHQRTSVSELCPIYPPVDS